MKKIFTAVCLAAAVFATQAQSVKIMKNGVAIASFEASEFDEVVFSPEESKSGLYDLAGTYDAHLSVSLVEMPQQGVLIDQDTEFTVTVTSDDAITLTLPGCFYAAMQMEMPGLNLENVEVVEADGVYSFTKEYSFIEEGTGKAVSGSVTGTINADRTFSITNNMKYGSMPFTLHEVLTPIVKTSGLESLAGKYDAHLSVSLVEMAQMGVLIDEDTEFTVAVNADNTVTLSLPGCYYAAMNETMPGVTLADISVKEADGSYSFESEYAFTEEGTGKSVSGSVSGTINSDRTFNIVNKLKYGAMPFTLNEVFTPIAK